MTIGKRILEFRREAKISQEKFAERLGITRQTLSNYENDITSPDLIQTKKIAELLDISIDELVGNNNLSSKISTTERLVKKQTKNTKIILVTIYFIILFSLISYIIYAFTNRDFTYKYQTEFTCHNKAKEVIKINGLNSITETIDNTDIETDFYIELVEFDQETKKAYSSELIYAGRSISEALDSIIKTKKVLLNEGYTCH